MYAMKLTLTKTETFILEPYGKFFISMARKPKSHLPHVIDFRELTINHNSSMPFTKEQEKEVVKMFKKHKTDILTDGSYFGFYTRAGSGEFASLCHVSHPKLVKYREDDVFRQLVDDTYKKD